MELEGRIIRPEIPNAAILRNVPVVKKLEQNHGRYCGETIDIASILSDALSLASQSGWIHESLSIGTRGIIPVFHRFAPAASRRIYISTGVHGDEPAGPLAALELIRRNQWSADTDIWLLPCLNPSGFALNRRENSEGVDLNRDYRHLRSDEVRAHVAWINRQQSFDLTLCLHEDWESDGFYVYELNPEQRPSYAAAMIKAVGAVCPIDLATEIEGRPAQGGIINPSIDPNNARPEWPEAFYLLQNKTRLSYTLESPSDFPLATRVAALVAATRVVLNA